MAPASSGPYSWNYQINAAIGNAANVTVTLSNLTYDYGVMNTNTTFLYIKGGNQKEINKSIDNIFKLYTTTNVDNVYSVTVSNITTLIDGYPLAIKFNAPSTRAITLKVNTLAAKSIVDYFGNPVTNVRQNLIVNLRYEATSGTFILSGKGGGGNVLSSQVLINKTYTSDLGPGIGTMSDNGTLTITSTKDPIAIAPGYYSGGTINSPQEYIDDKQLDDMYGSDRMLFTHVYDLGTSVQLGAKIVGGEGDLIYLVTLTTVDGPYVDGVLTYLAKFQFQSYNTVTKELKTNAITTNPFGVASQNYYYVYQGNLYILAINADSKLYKFNIASNSFSIELSSIPGIDLGYYTMVGNNETIYMINMLHGTYCEYNVTTKVLNTKGIGLGVNDPTAQAFYLNNNIYIVATSITITGGGYVYGTHIYIYNIPTSTVSLLQSVDYSLGYYYNTSDYIMLPSAHMYRYNISTNTIVKLQIPALSTETNPGSVFAYKGKIYRVSTYAEVQAGYPLNGSYLSIGKII